MLMSSCFGTMKAHASSIENGGCDRTTDDTPGFYENGAAASNDLYFRFQMFNSDSPDWYWPDPSYGLDNKILFLYPNRYTSKTDAVVDAGLYFNASGRCNPGAVSYAAFQIP